MENDIKKLGIVAGICLLMLTLMSAGLSCAVEQIVFYNYHGPIFPLTALSDTTGIAVERNMELDFSSYENTIPDESMYPFNKNRKVKANDNYTLTNTTNESITIEMLYPFSGTIMDEIAWVPEMSVNGNTAEVERMKMQSHRY